jgi:hypothetical protein
MVWDRVESKGGSRALEALDKLSVDGDGEPHRQMRRDERCS